jgi:hypothetical protein
MIGSKTKARKGELQYASGKIGAPKIKLLGTTAAQLVPAQGKGTYIEFVSLSLALKAGTNVLAETADNLAVYYTSEAGAQLSETIECTGFIDQAANTVTFVGPIVAEPIVSYTNSNNKPLVLANPNDEFTGNAANDAELHWKVAYRVHNFF